MEHDDKFEQARKFRRENLSVEIHLDHRIHDGICDTTHNTVPLGISSAFPQKYI